MANDQELKNLSRHLSDLVSATKAQNRILEKIQESLNSRASTKSEASQPDPTEEAPTDPDLVPRVLGWSAAALHQREGTLRVRDIKIEEDDSQWVWTREQTWERVERPSARALS